MNELPQGWNYFNDVIIRKPKIDKRGPRQAMVMLHGANIGNISGAAEMHAHYIQDTGEEFLDYCDANNMMLVLPSSRVIEPNGVLQQNWDWTGHFDKGTGVTDVITVIQAILDNGINKVWLHGGSGGGCMAWKVAIELERMAQIDMIRGLIFNQCISPFSTSVTDKEPPAFKRLDSTKEFSFAGFDLYDCRHTTPKLGLPNMETNWAKQTLYQYSYNDPIVPSKWKEDLEQALRFKATALTIQISGNGHDLGPLGWTDLVEWLEHAV